MGRYEPPRLPCELNAKPKRIDFIFHQAAKEGRLDMTPGTTLYGGRAYVDPDHRQFNLFSLMQIVMAEEGKKRGFKYICGLAVTMATKKFGRNFFTIGGNYKFEFKDGIPSLLRIRYDEDTD